MKKKTRTQTSVLHIDYASLNILSEISRRSAVNLFSGYSIYIHCNVAMEHICPALWPRILNVFSLQYLFRDLVHHFGKDVKFTHATVQEAVPSLYSNSQCM